MIWGGFPPIFVSTPIYIYIYILFKCVFWYLCVCLRCVLNIIKVTTWCRDRLCKSTFRDVHRKPCIKESEATMTSLCTYIYTMCILYFFAPYIYIYIHHMYLYIYIYDLNWSYMDMSQNEEILQISQRCFVHLQKTMGLTVGRWKLWDTLKQIVYTAIPQTETTKM